MGTMSANKLHFAPLEKIDHYAELIDREAVDAGSQTLNESESIGGSC